MVGVHQAYLRAGAEIIETNTFGANRLKLASFGLAEKVHAINLAGARIARHAARDAAWVAGSIGPLGVRVEPWGKTGLDEAQDDLRRTGRRSRRGWCRPVRARDVPGRQRDRRRDPRHPQRERSSDRRDADDGRGRQHARWHPGRAVRAATGGVRRRRARRELQRRSGGDARHDRASRQGGARRAACGDAQCRQAARRGRTQPLSVLAGLHGVLRAPFCGRGCPPDRRVLRHHARPRQADRPRGACPDAGGAGCLGGGRCRARRAAACHAGLGRRQVAVVECPAARSLRDRHRTRAAGRLRFTTDWWSRRGKRASMASMSCS